MSKEKRFNSKKNDYSSRIFEEKKPKLGILSDNVMSYYRNVSSTLESGFDADEDPAMKDNFLTNVYDTLKDEGIEVSQNQTVSRILEMLFSHSKPHHMQNIFCNFCRSLTVVVFDRFASHVFQSLIQHLPAIYESEVKTDHTDSDQTGSVHASIEQLCKFTESHMRDVMVDTYGSHVLRSLLEALGGVKVKEEVIRSRVSRGQGKDKADKPIPAQCKSLARVFGQSFKTLVGKIIHLCNFEDHLRDPSYCPVLQTVLLILHKTSPEEYTNLIKVILEKSCTLADSGEVDTNDVSKRLPDITQSEVGSYLVELIISLASEDQLGQLYDQIFKGKLIYFAVHPIANYILQKFLTVVVDPVMMKELLSDITQYLEDVLAVGHVGIITKLAQACRNTGTGQDEFLKAVMTAFHCQEPADRQIKVVPLLASLQTYEVFFANQETETELESSGSLLKQVNIHGSLLLQQLLQFTKPKLVVSSLLNLSPAELMCLCCDKCGSHVVDTFFQSPTVLDSNKFLFLKNMGGLYVNVACNRNGSRCLESIWKGSSLKSKILIAEELTKNQQRLEGDQWGHFLYRNFALFKFSQRRKEWMDIQGASTKKQQLLNDILQGKPRKKKQKKQSEALIPNDEVVTHVGSAAEGRNKKVKKSHGDDEGFASATTEQTEDGGQQKKKSKLEQTDDIDETATETTLKKKRNKDKKRVLRNAQLETSPDATSFGSDEKTAKPKKKHKKQ